MNQKLFLLSICLLGSQAYGADVVKKLTVEIDPLAPLAASIEQNSTKGATTSMWGGNIEFNVGSRFATGPEFWIGTFKRVGTRDGELDGREQDYFSDEKFKLDSTRLRWMVGVYEQGQSMRGWFAKAGISYMKTNSKATLRNSREHPLDDTTVPDKMESTVVDVRQGVVGAIGQRWIFFNNSCSLALAASFTANYIRNVSVDSQDPNAREDYDSIIEDVPGSKLSAATLPEANLTFGYIF
jgi:hypothetical protein